MPTTEIDISDLEHRLTRLEPHFVRLLAEVIRRCRPEPDLRMSGDLEERLADLNDLRRVLEDTIRIEVQQMRRFEGSTWPDIASALGMTRQGARQKYQHDADAVVSQVEELNEAEFQALLSEMEADLARARLEAVRNGQPRDLLDAELARINRHYASERAGPLIFDHLERLWEHRDKARASYGDD